MDKKIADIRSYLDSVDIDSLPNALVEFEADARVGVKKLLETYNKKYEKYCKEEERLESLHFYENLLYERGYSLLAGIDEVGRGPLAGPVVACAVILPKSTTIRGINDSKKLSESKRIELDAEIRQKAIAIGIGAVDQSIIDQINILQATYQAMRIAIQNLSTPPDSILIDAVTVPNIRIPQTAIVKGDEKSISIGAASIVAKVARDAMMVEYHEKYSQYSFDKNKGYGSNEHVQAIRQYGLCPLHRRSFTKKFKG